MREVAWLIDYLKLDFRSHLSPIDDAIFRWEKYLCRTINFHFLEFQPKTVAGENY